MNDRRKKARAAMLAAIIGAVSLAFCSAIFGNFGERSAGSSVSRPIPD